MTQPRAERIDREQRLRSASDYAEVKRLGTALRGRHCLLLWLARPGDLSKVGFIASRKSVGGAVQRNRARRRLREIVRRRWVRVPRHGHWLVFIATRGVLAAPHDRLIDDVETLMRSVGALAPVGA